MAASSTPTEHFPTIRGVKWPNMISIVVTHILAIYGALYVTPTRNTAILAVVLYFISTLGKLLSALLLPAVF